MLRGFTMSTVIASCRHVTPFKWDVQSLIESVLVDTPLVRVTASQIYYCHTDFLWRNNYILAFAIICWKLDYICSKNLPYLKARGRLSIITNTMDANGLALFATRATAFKELTSFYPFNPVSGPTYSMYLDNGFHWSEHTAIWKLMRFLRFWK